MITKPMLAPNELVPLDQIPRPVLGTPKKDGIRCLKLNGKALTRKFLPVPNDYIRSRIEAECPDNIDGEIMIAGRTFHELSGDVRRKEGRPDFTFYVFDYVGRKDLPLNQPYSERMNELHTLLLPDFCVKLEPIYLRTLDDLIEFEAECLAGGDEGAMVRTPMSRYKCGRATIKEALIFKIKQFVDDEATILYAEEEQENQNEALKDAFGRTKRSSHQENKVGKSTLGTLQCEWRGVQFGIGTGWDDEAGAELWAKRDRLPGQKVTFKYQKHGTKDRPRCPVYKGIRWDL